jgi:peptidyl-prolyl cis-trans isomerase B (cyclophilin B)
MAPMTNRAPPPGWGQQWNQQSAVPGGYPPYVPPRHTNGMAIAALVGSLVFAPLGIVFGHIARSQIRRTSEEGSGLAIAGLAIGYIFTGLALLYVIALVVLLVVAMQNDSSHSSTYTTTSYSAEMAAYS